MINRYAVGHSSEDLAYSGEMWYFPQENITFITLVNYGLNGERALDPIYEAYRASVVSVLQR